MKNLLFIFVLMIAPFTVKAQIKGRIWKYLNTNYLRLLR